MKYVSLIVIVFLCLLSVQPVSAQTNSGNNTPDPELMKQDQAVVFGEKAARAWLQLLDEGKYAESWKQAAPLFKQSVPEKDWVKGVTTLRSPLGKLLKREVATVNYATEMPGAPDGEYVLLRYITKFSNKKSTVETVTPMRCKDGSWRVSGYFIR